MHFVDEGIEQLPETRNVLEIVERFGLNREQAEAVRHVDSWIPETESEATRPPICLIHGPFGSGKSTLLLAIIHALVKPKTEVKKVKGLFCAIKFTLSLSMQLHASILLKLDNISTKIMLFGNSLSVAFLITH